MARIRTIKPEFFTSEDIVSLTPLARLFYQGLWCFADREGRLHWKLKSLKLKILPGDNCDVEAISRELVDAGLVAPYEVEGEPYAVIPSFKKHQAINVREAESTIPSPGENVHTRARTCGKRQALPKDVRETVFDRDNGQCVRCGSSVDLTIDHIFPVSMGGTDALTNLRTLCRTCNSARPVAGKGLLDDLATDGLTFDDMRSMCMHVQKPGERKGREWKVNKTPHTPSEGDGAFGEFWAEYPRHENKQQAIKSWQRLRPTEETQSQIMASLEAYKQSDQWRRGIIPHAATWLNQGRWMDELIPTDLPKPQSQAPPTMTDWEREQEMIQVRALERLRAERAARAAQQAEQSHDNDGLLGLPLDEGRVSPSG